MSASEVPVIWVQAQNLHNDFMKWKIKETKHTIRPWHTMMYGYSTGACEWMEMAMSKKR